MRLTVPWPPSALASQGLPFHFSLNMGPNFTFPWTPGARQRLHLGRRRSEEENDEDEQVAPKRKILDPEGVASYKKQT